MPKKICDKCKKENGTRARRCKFCDAGFAFKIKKDRSKVIKKIDWKELQNGDVIKVLGGGPVWKPVDYDPNAKIEEDDDEYDDDEDEDEDGSSKPKSKTDKISMGYRGKFKVFKLDKDGIIACGIERNSGYCHIWMAGEKIIDGKLLKKPHRIAKVAC